MEIRTHRLTWTEIESRRLVVLSVLTDTFEGATTIGNRLNCNDHKWAFDTNNRLMPSTISRVLQGLRIENRVDYKKQGVSRYLHKRKI